MKYKHLLFLALACIVGAIASAASASVKPSTSAPSVSTDRQVYLVGDTAVVSWANFVKGTGTVLQVNCTLSDGTGFRQDFYPQHASGSVTTAPFPAPATCTASAWTYTRTGYFPEGSADFTVVAPAPSP